MSCIVNQRTTGQHGWAIRLSIHAACGKGTAPVALIHIQSNLPQATCAWCCPHLGPMLPLHAEAESVVQTKLRNIGTNLPSMLDLALVAAFLAYKMANGMRCLAY